MLTPYIGEFLISPIPLELSLNWCSHHCTFCFANLGKPDRKAKPTPIKNLITDFHNRETLEARLLQQGYPVLISNRVDPFAGSNYRLSLEVIELLVECGVPMAFQTRGGFGVDDALRMIGPSCFYVSFNTADESVRKRIEPGAPTIASRFELIEKLIDGGHSVALAINPLVPDWMPEPEQLLERVKGMGVETVWTEMLHFNYRQLKPMPPADREAIGEDIIKRAMRRTPDPEWLEHYHRTVAAAGAMGFETYSVGNWSWTGFWLPYAEYYDNLFPTMTDFLNHAHETSDGDAVFSFEEFAAFMVPELPRGVFPLDHYIGATAHDVWWRFKVPKHMTYRQLLGIYWRHPQTAVCPAAWANCCWLKDGDYLMVDENKMPFLAFRGDDRTDSYFMDVADLDGGMEHWFTGVAAAEYAVKDFIVVEA